MLSPEKWKQYGFEREGNVQGITIHSTSSQLTAKQVYDYLENISKDERGCHFIVDDTDVLEVIPESWSCYHTGMGLDFGNKFTLAIELCSNIDNQKFNQGLDNMIALIESLMSKYNLKRSDIYFHCDWNKKVYCPSDIIRIYGTKKNFLDTFINRR